MAYQSLYRRYRPRRFSEVRGQEHLVSALRNAVREERIGHAYLFSGPRGTGKTSTARILAKVLNCENPQDGEPCCECASCLAIESGTSFDVHELDAASNNGVEAVRDLIAKASLGTPGRTKVYILDEVHMLSTAASNALLKTLEEPPDHVVFVLATTDPQKVLPTIRSRTQHFEVHLLPASDLESLVDDVVADAGLEVDDAARAYVLRAGGGSARDTLSALDRVVAAGGVPDDVDAVDELVEALCDRDTGRALVAVEAAMARGRSPRVLGESLIARLRDVFLAAVRADLSRLSEADRERCEDQARRLTAAGATRALELLGEAFVGIQDALDPRIPLEVALVRLTRPDADTSPQALAERLARLERAVAEGGVVGPPAGVSAGPAPAPPSRPAPAEAPEPTAATEAAPAAPVEAADRPDADVDHDDLPPLAPRSPSGGRPGDVAREQLAKVRGGPAAPSKPGRPAGPAQASPPAPSRPAPNAPSRPDRPAAGAPSAGGPPPPSRPSPASTAEAPPTPAPAEAPLAGATPASPAPAAAPAASSATGGAMPDRDQITLAWGDQLIATLPHRTKSRFTAGRWLAVEGETAVFGFPNAHYVGRGEDCKGDVEAALAAHFGRPIAVRIVVDEHAEEPARPGSVPVPTSTPEDEAIDVAELTDATDVADTHVDRVAAVFPGAELVDDTSDRLA